MPSIADRVLAVELKTKTVTIPEWGVEIGLREMDAAQRVKFGEDAKKIPALALVRLIISCAFDPATGAAAFEPAHQDALLKKSGAVIDRLATEICDLSGLTDKAATEAEKN